MDDLNARSTTIDTDEAARRIGLQPGTLHNMRWRGDGPPFLKIGGRVRYRVTDLAEWLDSRRRSSTSDPGPRSGGSRPQLATAS